MSKKYNFIDNKPLGKDLFESQSQESTAKVICDIIKENQFQVIGIDGGWGVGKSNLVQIVDDKLKGYSFFIYDVWGHQEDEQRRSLLVELTEFISDEKNNLVKNEAKWKNKLKKLLSKEKEVTTENQPYLSPGFIASVISVIYTPTALAFKDEFTFEDWLYIPAIIWKVLLWGLPWLIVFALFIKHLIDSRKNSKGFRELLKSAFQETFQVYTDKQKKETKIETISEYEPPVKAFQDWMSEIDKDLKDKKLVLVLDNFDRLPKNHILNVWSSIHVFFAEKTYTNIKVIIPFDRKHIKNAFKDLNGESENENFADDYINKTFDIVFRVAPPILSSWKIFFKTNWKNAFPSFSEDEYERVELAYEILRPNITPREIVAFINDCVSTKLLQESIPDRYIAIFLLNREIILNHPLNAINNLDYLRGLKSLYEQDTKYAEYITALAYQINPENALEVVYRKQLKDSLVNKDNEKFTEISKTQVFTHIIKPVLNEIKEYGNPILVLKELEVSKQVSQSRLDNIWQSIYAQVKAGQLSTGKLEEAQIVLLSKLKSSFKTEWLKLILSSFWVGNEGLNIDDYVKNIDGLREACSKMDWDVDVLKYVEKKKVSVEHIKQLVELKGDEYLNYKLSCSSIEIDEYLEGLAVSELDEAEFIYYMSNAGDFKKFTKKLYEYLQQNKNNKDHVKRIIDLLKLVDRDKFDVSTVLADADIYTLISNTQIDEEVMIDLAALRLSLLSKSHASYQGVYSKVLNIDDDEFSSSVAQELEWYINYHEFLVGSTSFTNALVKSVVKQLLLIERNHESYCIEPIIKNLIPIADVNELNTEEILNSLEDFPEGDYLVKELLKLDSKTLEILFKSDSKAANMVIELLTNHFKGLIKEGWNDIFSDLNSSTFDNLRAINFNQWNAFALEEFKSLLLHIVDESEIEEIEVVEWLIESFKSSGKSLENTFKSIRDRLILNDSISTEVFNLLLKPVVDFGKLIEKPDDSVRTIFNSELLDNSISVGLMKENADQLKILFSKSSTTSKSDFREGLQARSSDENIYELARLLGFKIKKSNKKDGEESDEQS
ncbi:P-loop NTPase fold protein [Fulvivirga lutea]|uniref:KAP NTPase domain-containing protein n=1 Tax=Fulvivirga lutea TaxID=2810512 RepID=A0A974WJM2_9BACT|nr:P-loop NTPase fold protein [Fulvivirga lutea]QSE99169.1 hypothetical protein JR347_08790 [Fulvivirga lutea]